jgi:hypothetical protein
VTLLSSLLSYFLFLWFLFWFFLFSVLVLSFEIQFPLVQHIWPSPQVNFFWNYYVQTDAVAWQDSCIQPNLDLGQQVLYAPRRRSARLNNIFSVDSD